MICTFRSIYRDWEIGIIYMPIVIVSTSKLYLNSTVVNPCVILTNTKENCKQNIET